MQRLFGINKKTGLVSSDNLEVSKSTSENSISFEDISMSWSPEKLAREAVVDSPEYVNYMAERYDRLKQVLSIIETVNKLRQRMGLLLADFVLCNESVICELKDLDKLIQPEAQVLLKDSIDSFQSIKNVFEDLSNAINNTEIISDRAEIKKSMQTCQNDLKGVTNKMYRKMSRKVLKTTKDGNTNTLFEAEAGDSEDKSSETDDLRKKLVEKNLAWAAKDFNIDGFINEDVILGLKALRNPFTVFFKMGHYEMDSLTKNTDHSALKNIRELRNDNLNTFHIHARSISEKYLSRSNRNPREVCTKEGLAVHHQKIFSKRVFLQFNSGKKTLTKTNLDNLKDVTVYVISKADRLFNDTTEVINGFDVITVKDSILTFTVYDEEEREHWLSSFGITLSMSLSAISPIKMNYPFTRRAFLISILCLESCALQTEGIYRISTTLREVELLMSKIVKMEENIFMTDSMSAHVYSGCVKKMLESMNYIISVKDYESHFAEIECYEGTEELNNLLPAIFKKLIDKLQPEPKFTLKVLCQHLTKVNKYEECNKMSIRNLAACLMPRIFQFEEQKMFSKFTFMITLVSFMLENFSKIFECKEDDPYGEEFTVLVRDPNSQSGEMNSPLEDAQKIVMLYVNLVEDSLPSTSPDLNCELNLDETTLKGISLKKRQSTKMKQLYNNFVSRSKNNLSDSPKN